MTEILEAAPVAAPKGKAARTLETILVTAIECYEQYGLVGTTLELIAEQTGISRATVYRHVRNRRELLNLVFERDSELAMQQLMSTVSYRGSLSDLVVDSVIFLSSRRKFYAMQIVMDQQEDGIIKNQGIPMSILTAYAERFLAAPYAQAEAAGDVPEKLTLPYLCDWVGRLMRSLLVDPPAVVKTEDEFRQYLQALLAPIFRK